MRISRVYFAGPLRERQKILLDEGASNHVLRVLRLTINTPLIIFNGDGNEYNAKITAIDKIRAELCIGDKSSPKVESNLDIHLAQALARGEKMDFIIQKATELGIFEFTPLFTENANVVLDKERSAKKLAHWQKVAISAAEQSGRCKIPKIFPIKNFTTWLNENATISGLQLILHPETEISITSIIKKAAPAKNITLLVGPEGGFSAQEMVMAEKYNFQPANLGKRILRTETAALTAISIIQAFWGDLAE